MWHNLEINISRAVFYMALEVQNPALRTQITEQAIDFCATDYYFRPLQYVQNIIYKIFRKPGDTLDETIALCRYIQTLDPILIVYDSDYQFFYNFIHWASKMRKIDPSYAVFTGHDDVLEAYYLAMLPNFNLIRQSPQ